MDTNSNIPEQKKFLSVEILHLDELGYGPKGEHTRRAWRAECLEHLLYGSVTFKYWQEQILKQLSDEYKTANFDCYLQFETMKVRAEVVGVRKPTEPSLIPLQIPRYSLDFSGCEFDSEISLFEHEFILPVIFSWATFRSWVSFASCTFRKNADFLGTKFLRHSHFTSSCFLGFSNFTNAFFGEYTDFEGVSFESVSLFKQIEFKGSAKFNKVRFVGNSIFNDSNFDSFAYFSNAIFLNQVHFQGVIFNIFASFRNVEFNQQCEFNNNFNTYHEEWSPETVFNANVDFENAIFKNVGHFERVQFTKFIPSFLGVDTATTRLEFSGDNYFTKNDISEDAIKRLGLLKRLADEHGQTDQALNFNALELRAKALQPDADFWVKWFTLAYEIVSDFGRSFTKPLKFYIRLLLITLFLASAHAVYYTNKECKNEYATFLSYLWRDQVVCEVDITKPVQPAPLSGWRAAFEYTIYRSAGILDFSDNGKGTEAVAQRLFGQSIEPWWMRIYGVFKAIASTALLFLAALGLRNKYRIK